MSTLMNESVNHDIRFIRVRGIDSKFQKKWYIHDLTLNKDLPYTFSTPQEAIKKSRSLDRIK